MSYRIEMSEVQGSEMEIFLYEPEGAGPHPGLVLCQHIPGHQGIEGDPFTVKTAERFRANGYAVSVPFLYHWWSKSDDMQIKRDEFNDAQTALDLKAGFDALAALGSVDAGRIGVVGHCWGGRVSWLGACTDSRYSACAVFYGGGVKEVRGDGQPARHRAQWKHRVSRHRRFRQRGSEPLTTRRERLRGGAQKCGRGIRFPPLRRRGPRLSVGGQPRALPRRAKRGLLGENAGVF